MVRILRAHLPEISERYKVKSLGVFGSYLRNEQKPDSDLDVLIDCGDGFISLLGLVNLQNYLSDLVGVKVDLVERKGLKPYIGKRILSEVVWLQRDGAEIDIPIQEIARRGRSHPVSPQREYLDYLNDIVDAMGKVQRFIAGVGYDEFAENEEKIYAVTHAIEIIGEAVKNIPSEVKERYPDIPWKNMAGMRDRIAHGYWGVDLEKVWAAATREIPEDKPRIARILAEETRRRAAAQEENSKP